MTIVDAGADSHPASYAGIEDLLVALDNGVLGLTFNRPDSLNSLTAPMLNTFAAALELAASDPQVRVDRISGAGRGLSSGAGISAADHANPGAAGTPAEVLDAANRSTRAIVDLPQPAVAVVQGPAAGVGASLALACDVVLASQKAFFMLAFTKIGLMPDGGASALIAAAVGRIRAMRMVLLAERISAADAYQWGLVSAVYQVDDFICEVDKVVAKLGSGPAMALQETKDAINAATLTELESALERESRGQLALLDSPDFREGAKAFQQRRSPNFGGC